MKKGKNGFLLGMGMGIAAAASAAMMMLPKKKAQMKKVVQGAEQAMDSMTGKIGG